MNVQQSDQQIILEFSLVGILKEDVRISIKDRVLSLEARRKETLNEKNYQYREFGPVDLKTKVQLPEDIDQDSVQAEFLNGVLKISIQKVKKTSTQIEVK